MWHGPQPLRLGASMELVFVIKCCFHVLLLIGFPNPDFALSAVSTSTFLPISF
ncbi:hypothetical protein VPHD479_0371 [Vibrio phage D479]